MVTWYIGYGLDFLLGLWLFLLGALALEKGSLPWLAIILLPKLFFLSRLRCSGVAFVPMVGRKHCYIVYGEMSTPIFLTVTTTDTVTATITNTSTNLSLSLSPSLSLIYHHQPTITRSTHMDTKDHHQTMYKNLYHTMYINHVPKHVPYYASTIHQNLYHTMYLNHVPEPLPYHVHQSCIKLVPSHVSTIYHITHGMSQSLHTPCTIRYHQ
jgi:hypothetical protein